MPAKHIVKEAIRVANKSKHEFRVGAVLYKGGSIIRASFNTKQYINYRRKNFIFVPTRHAEMACMHLMPLDVLNDCSMLVVRVSKANTITCAKPCSACLSAMLNAGIKKIFYSDYDGEIVKLQVKTTAGYSKDRIN